MVHFTSTLSIFRYQSPVKVLGPFQRAVIWVQGCHLGCEDCIVPESWDEKRGDRVAIPVLRDWILAQSEIEGVTLSGGEPFLQAGTLVDLIQSVKTQRDLGWVCYTGFRYEHLQTRGTAAQQALLDQVDLLIDGPYLTQQQDDLLWRGSTNQRLLCLSDRYQTVVSQALQGGDRSAGLEFSMDETGAFSFTGVPPQPGFRQEFEARLQQRGIHFVAEH